MPDSDNINSVLVMMKKLFCSSPYLEGSGDCANVRQLITAVLVAGICCCISLSRAADYTRSVINLPASTTAFDASYDLDGDGRKDILVLFQRRILIFFQNDKASFPIAPDVEIGAGAPIPDDYAAVTVGKVSNDPGLQLVLIGTSGVDYISVAPLRGKSSQPVEPRSLLSSRFDISSEPNLQFLNAAVDIDGNSKTDLVLPNSDQLEIYSPSDSGEYSLSTKIYVPLKSAQQTALRDEPHLMGSPYSYQGMNGPPAIQQLPRLGRWHGIQFAVMTYSEPFLLTDFNLDKRLDIIAPNNLLLQSAAGKFETNDSGVYSRIASALALGRGSRGGTPSPGDFVFAPNLVDFNADGILDTFRVEASAAKLSPRTDVSIYLGKKDRTIAEEPDYVLRTRDVAYSEVIPIGDINRDGAQDIALFHLDFQPSSASSQLKAYMRNGLDGELRFYLWDKKRERFPESHSFSHPVTVNYDIYGARQLFRQQVVMNHDIDGDKWPDLVIKTGPQQISVFKNLEGKRFGSRAASVISTSPTRFSSLDVHDLNKDGKGDMIVSGYTEDHEDRVIYSLFVSR